MLTKYIFGALSIIFLALATILGGSGAWARQESRTWLLIGAIFGVVSAWLFYQDGP